MRLPEMPPAQVSSVCAHKGAGRGRQYALTNQYSQEQRSKNLDEIEADLSPATY